MLRNGVLAVAVVLALVASGDALQITQLEFEFSLSRGEAREFSFQIRNDGDSTQRITTQLGDWERDPEGNHVFLNPGALPRSLSTWLQVSPRSFTLSPGGVQEISGVVRVPSDPQQGGGTYWGIIFVQGEPRLEEREGAMILAVERFGVKVLVDLPPHERDLHIAELQPRGLGPLWVELEVANRGDTNLPRIGGHVSVYDSYGEELGVYQLNSFPCLPGATRKVHIETDIWLTEPGDYNVLVTVDADVDHLIAAQRMVRLRPLALQPLEDGRGTPQDLSGDGLYEDLLGDGSFHQGDVDLLAEYLYHPTVQRNRRAFDFSNDGMVDEEDVAALAERLEAWED